MTKAAPASLTIRRVLQGLVLIAVAVGVVMVARAVDPRALRDTMARARFGQVVLAAAANFVNLGWRSAYWWLLVGAAAPIPFLRMYRYTIVSVAASALAPARAGEALRLWLLRRDFDVPMRYGGTVLGFEKFADMTALLLLVAPLPWLLSSLPSWFAAAMRFVSLFALVALIAVVALWTSGRLRAWLRVPRGVRRVMPLGFFAVLLSWLTEMVEVALVLSAVGIHVSWASCALILLAVNVAVTVPATPGHAGTLELAAIAALDALGVSAEQATAFALLYHAMQLVPIIVVGLALGKGAARRPAAAAEQATAGEAHIAVADQPGP